jgi:hypothetical protein
MATTPPKNTTNSYTSLDNAPYNKLLQRENDLTFQFGQQTSLQSKGGGGPAPVTGSGGDDGTTQTKGGSVATIALKTAGNATDVWIQNFIRSVNWKPKTVGFYINGRTGYAEFANIFVSGTAVIASGTIGGFKIGPTYIRDAANSFGLSSVAGATEVRFWAGDTYDNRAIAPFRVIADGSTFASNITVNGTSLVDTSVLAGLIAQNNLAIANQSWGQSCTFTPVDFDTVTWGAGVISFSDGNDYNITGSTTGNMATNKVYIYFDLDVSTTAYQQTSNVAVTTGPNKAIVAVITKNSNPASKATYQLFGGGGGAVIDGGTIAPGSISYTELKYPPLSGAGVPLFAPGNFGQLYIDLTNLDAYIATGSSTEADWRLITIAAYVATRSASVYDTVTASEDITLTIV